MHDEEITENQRNRQSIKALLATRLTIAAVVLSIIAGVGYAFISSQTIEDFYKHEGLQATSALAALSELALLYDSGENVREAALATLKFPSIKHVAIINKKRKIIFGDGKTNDETMASLQEKDWTNSNAYVAAKTTDTWHIVAPVYTSADDDADPDLMMAYAMEESRSYLGYVVVQVDASQVRDALKSNLFNHLLIGFGYGFVFLVVVSLALSRLIKPMSALAGTMDSAKSGEYVTAEIDKNASQEVYAISNAYNRMISALEERDMRLRGQKDVLETEVALRTSELIQARDAALEANKYKSEILANVTHELRTPLQSILGYTDILQEVMLDESFEECLPDLEKISRNASHLLELINSILDISKIEAGKMEVHTEKTDVEAIVHRVRDTIIPIVKKNGSDLDIQFDSRQKSIFIDSTKVYQILLNLASNAAKFTHEGKITIKGQCELGLLVLSVSDTGIGMSKEQQRQIFEPFRQLDGGESRKFEGTGLGLSIVLKFAEILGGQVRIESELGVGSTFTVELPIAYEQMSYEKQIS